MTSSKQFCVTKSRWYIALKDEVKERLKETVKVYEETEMSLSILEAAKLYAIWKTILYSRIKGHQDQLSHAILKHKLTPEEEESIQNWVLEIQSWGFPPKVAQLHEMAEKFLQARHDFKALGKNWTAGFLNHHLVSQSK